MPFPRTLVRAAARSLSGGLYVSAGWDVLRAPGGRVGKAGPVLARLRTVVPLPLDDETLVRANGALQCAAGAALAVGVRPRTAAGLLAASLVPTTVAGHAFWTVDDPVERRAQRLQFGKNMAMLGGLLYATLD